MNVNFQNYVKHNFKYARSNNENLCCGIVSCNTPEIADLVEKNMRKVMKVINHRPMSDIIFRQSRYTINILAYDPLERMARIFEVGLFNTLYPQLPKNRKAVLNASLVELNGDASPAEFYRRALNTKAVIELERLE